MADTPSNEADPAITAQVVRAWNAFRIGDAEGGITAARSGLAVNARHGALWHVLGACHERAGRLGRADRCFHRAAHAQDEPQAMPYRITWSRFCALVERTVTSLPAPLAAAFGEVTLVLADYADVSLLDDLEERELLGVFTGPTRAERSPASTDMELTPRVHLFRRAHEHSCSTREEFTAEVRSTVIHEFGHYLGYDEDELEAMGWG